MKNPEDINHCCLPCGHKAMELAGLTATAPTVITMHQGVCDACGITTGIAHVRFTRYAFTFRQHQVAHWT